MGEARSDQAAVLDFMASPDAYGRCTARLSVSRPRLRSLPGWASRYKIKLAVRYPFLDFSDPGAKGGALLNELRLNRRTAPQLYLEVLPLTVNDSGRFHISGQGEIVEWVLVMRRFDQSKLLDRMAEQGRLLSLPCRSLPEPLPSSPERESFSRRGGKRVGAARGDRG
jgi:hypothetical protein